MVRQDMLKKETGLMSPQYQFSNTTNVCSQTEEYMFTGNMPWGDGLESVPCELGVRPLRTGSPSLADYCGITGFLGRMTMLLLLLVMGSVLNTAWAASYTYTYQVIDLSNGLATKAQVTAAGGTPPSIPDVIKTNLVTGYHYWATGSVTVSGGTYTVNGGASELANLPEGDATIYVTYDYNNASSLIDLTGTKVYYVKDGNPEDVQDCHYLSLQYGNNWISPSWVIEDEIDIDSKRQWRFEGGDPYKIYFRNIYAETYSPLYNNTATAGPYMRSDLSAGSFGDNDNVRFGPKNTDKLFNTYFIDTNGRIVAANNVWNLNGTTNRYIYLAKQDKTTYQTSGSRFYITGSGKINFGYLHYSVSQRPTHVNYTILTKQKKAFMTVEGDAAERLHLPSLVQSPLVSTYHYWPASAYADSNSDGIYEKDNAVAELDASSYTATEGETIYVTYDYDADNAVEFGSNTVHVDLTGKTRYTINTGSEASKRYITWRYDVKRTLVTSNDSYYTGRNYTTEPATWNDYWFWTLGYEDGSEPDPYAIVIKSGVPTQYPIVGGENYVLSVYQGTGTDNSNTDIWSIPKDADGSSYVKTWALLTDNKLVCRKPGTATKVNRFNADGSTRPNNYDEMGTNGAVLLNAATIGYYVVNRSGQIAVSTRVNRVYTGNLSVPDDLKSAHIIDDGLHYRYFSTQADAAAYSANPSDETAIEHNSIQTYAQLAALGSTEVYVGYHYDPANIPDGVPAIDLQASSTSLSGIARYHVQINNKYWKASDVNWHNRPNFGDGGNELVSANYQWLFVSGNSTLPDPYDIRIKTPYWPDGYLHDMLDNVENGNTNGAYSTGHGMYLNRTTGSNNHGHDEVHSFFFTRSDIGIVVSVATLPNKQGRQSYLYNHNNQYALLQRGTRGGDSRQKFEFTKLRLFRVVNKAGDIAVSAYMPATSPLTVPTGLRTPLMTESQYRFFTTQEKAATYNLNPTDAVAIAQGVITTAPATGEIFIGYNYVNNPQVMDLEGSRWYNIKGFLAPNTTATSYYYYQDTSGDVFKAKTEKSDAKNFMFQFTGNDPYNIVIYNAQEWNNNKQPLFRWGRDWGFNIIQQRNRLDDNNGSRLHFMMLEHEDGYTTLAVHNNWWYNGNFNLGAAGSDVYIGTKYYLYFWGFNSDRLRMMNNDNYYYYYSDRNRNGNYATKLVFEPIQYTSTIHIIDNSGREAIKYTGPIDANMPIDFAHIPASIRSPFLIDETITGYSTATANGTSTDGRTIWNLSNVITQTPATTGGHIYIRYTTDHVYEKPFRLTGVRSFNVRINGNNYIYSTGTGNEELAVTSDESGKTTNPYYWHLLGDGSSNTPGSEHGGDPYAFRLWNDGAGNGKYLKYSTSTGELTLDGTNGEAGTYFIAMRNNVNALYEVMAAGTGMDASENYYNIGYDGTNVKLFGKSQQPQGSPVLQILLSTNELTTTYYIIDKSKKIVVSATENALELGVPASISSPLVSKYHYWTRSDFTVSNGSGGTTPNDNLDDPYATRNDTYTLTGSTELETITSADTEGDVYQIYVTYDVNDRIQFNGRDKGADGKMYMLRFNNGSSFYQEDGKDGINHLNQSENAVVKSDVALPAVYPYSNGDANLYIYGEQMWATQSGNAATTRGRWQWYVESENDDPYHVMISSRQSQNSNYNYFRTYKPQEYSEVVTGVITKSNTSAANYVSKQQDGESNVEYTARVARQVPTEYMVLGAEGAFKLTTVDPISDGSTNERRTVTSFEQYWKTYDTAKKKLLGNTDPDKETDPAIVTNSADRLKLQDAPYGWHAYKAWASAKRWNGYNGVTNKQAKGYEYLERWFQTIPMGDGSFDFIETELNGALILVDNHGWEIMRKPMPTGANDPERAAKYAAIKPYDSPMVKAYHFYKSGSKIPGYHKFNLSNPCMVGDDEYTSTSLTNLPPIELAVDEDGNHIDWYVSYEVKEEYATSYLGAAAKENCKASAFLIHQGSSYAMTTDGTSISTTIVPDEAISTNNTSLLTEEMFWMVQPNFDIDVEMGYKYPGEIGAQVDAEEKTDMQAHYFNTGMPGCNNGFDPYNMQIVNKAHGGYFTTNATASNMTGHGGWQSTYPGTTGQLGLAASPDSKFHATGDDNALLNITNATFMAVDDGNGNIRLMPRFDHNNVMTNFATIETQIAAAPVNDNSGSQTTRLLLPASYVYIVVDNSGYESIRYRGNIGDVSPSIPAYLASPLAKDFKFYKNLINDGSVSTNGTNIGIYTEVAKGTDISAKEIKGTFGEAGLTSTENIIYVRYSFNPEGDKYKILSEGGWHTISIDGKPLWVNYSPDENNPTIPIGSELPSDPGYEWQCKFIYNPDTEVPDPYNASTFNRVKPNKRWDIHYAVLAHGNEIAYILARQGDYDYKFLSSVKDDGTAATTINFYKEPYFDGTATYTETVSYTDPVTSETITETVTRQYDAGTFNGTVSQITFGDIPEETVTYYVITNDGHLALTAKEPAARAKGEPSKPTAILPPWARSPLLNIEDFTYYMQATANGNGTYSVNDEDLTTRMIGLPENKIYVRYNYNVETTPFTVKDTYFTADQAPRYLPLDLTGNTWYNIVTYSWGDDWLYTREADNQVRGLDRPAQNQQFTTYPKKNGNFEFQSTKPYLWRLVGSDPYAFKMVNSLKGNNRYFSGKFSDSTPDGTSLMPQMLTKEDNADITTFMILKPMSNSNDIRIVATGRLNYYLSNTRWGSNWISYYDKVDESNENPFQGVSYHGYEFFKAPVVRNYTFHAMNCDDGTPVNTWTMTLQRDWLTKVKLEDDIKRICAKYEKEGTHEFVDIPDAGNGRFYRTPTMSDAEADRIKDESTGEYDVYPEIEENATYDIYFRYKTKPTELAEYTSTEEQISSDVAYRKTNGRLDQEQHPGDAKWWFMVLDTDYDLTRTVDGSGKKTYTGKQQFLRREDNGNVGWMNNDFALHANKEDNYNNYSYHRMAEWYKQGDNDAFREGRWLWAFVGTDPYLMKIINLESAVGVTAESEGVYTLTGADNCYTTMRKVTHKDGSVTYPVVIPTTEPGDTLLWGMAPGFGSENTFSLVAPITNTNHQALFWTMGSSAKTDSLMGVGRATDRSQAIRLLRYEPVQYEDVMLVIRRNDEVAKYQAATAKNKPEVLAAMTTGLSKLYFAASERMFEAEDKIDMSDEKTLPINVRRAFCKYTLYKDIFTTVGGNYTVKEGPYPTNVQATTQGTWSGPDSSGKYTYDSKGYLLYDEDGKPVWTYTEDGTVYSAPVETGAQSIYASYEVTSDIFLKTPPTKAEVETMYANNDHVYFMDFPGESTNVHHAFFDNEAKTRIQTDDLSKKIDKNLGTWKTEKKKASGSGTNTFVDDTAEPYNHLQFRTTEDRMFSIPEHLKWYFVGDPYKVQVFNTYPGDTENKVWNTESVTDLNGKTWVAGTKAANLARFNPVETNFQFVVDCVHMRLPDYSNKDTRAELTPTDSLGHSLDPIPNRNVNKPYFDDFYWECVPAASDEEGTFALRFKEDNDLLGYRNVYYYLAHDGLTRTYRSAENQPEVYHINLNYDADNKRQQTGDYIGYHAANNSNSVIRLVQPVKLYISAFKEMNGNNPVSQWTPNPDTGGYASSSRWERKTRDEVSEYYGLGETIKEVPRHLQRKFVKYGTINYQLIEPRAYTTPLDECSAHTDNVFVTGTKINPIFKLNVSYKVDDLTNTANGKQVHLFSTCIDTNNPAASELQWLDVMVGNNNWLYYDKLNVDQKDVVSNYCRALSTDKTGWNGEVNGWTDGLKGLHWAFIGDPYDFKVINRRRYENGTAGTDPMWLKSSDNLVMTATPASATHYSTRMWKTGGKDEYVLTTGSTMPTTSKRMVAQNSTTQFHLMDYPLSDRRVYTANENDLNYNNYVNNGYSYNKPLNGLGGMQQKLQIRTAVAKDEDEADNDCFDSEVRIYTTNHVQRIKKKGMEIKYGKADKSLPYSLRRYGCTYTCYLVTGNDSVLVSDFDSTTKLTFTDPIVNGKTFREFIDSKTPFRLSYVYEVEDETSQFFTTKSNSLTDDYTWMNTYFAWNQTYSGTNVEVEYYVDVFDHYVYNSAGQIVDEVYVKERRTRVVSNPTEAYPTTAYLNSHTNQTNIYADEGTQSESDRQKWSLVGDPYEFTMKNYAQYLEKVTSALTLDGENVVNTTVSKAAQNFAIALDKDGKPYLAVIDSNGEATTLISFTFDSSTDKHLQKTGSGTNQNDPTGNTLDSKNAKPFMLANLIRYADILQYHLVIAHQHSLDYEDTGLTEAQLSGYDSNGSPTGINARLVEFLHYREKLDEVSAGTYIDANAVPNGAGKQIVANEMVKELLKKHGTLRDFLSFPIADYSVSRVGIGNHPQVPWYMKRQFCRYHLYQKDVMRSEPDSENPFVVSKGGKDYYVWVNETENKRDTLLTTDVTHKNDAKWYQALNVKWVSVRDMSYWKEQPSDATGDSIVTVTASDVALWGNGLVVGTKRKIPKYYNEVTALNGKVLDKLQECHFNRKVLIDVVYEVIPEEFRFADKGRNTTAWYQMMTNNEADGLMNFTYKDGIGARLDRKEHYTNNYLWAPEGDPYGFILRSRYATINGNGWDNVAVTTKGALPTKDNYDTYSETAILAENPQAYDAKYTDNTAFNDKRIIHVTTPTHGPTNAVYEMFTGDINFENSFLMHPTSAYLDNTDSDFKSYYMKHFIDKTDPSNPIHTTKLIHTSGRTLQTDADANWNLHATAEQLWPYFKYANYVGGLDATKATEFTNMGYYNQLKAAIEGGPQPDFATMRKIQELVYSGTFKTKSGTTLNYTDPRPGSGRTGALLATELPLTFTSDNLVNMTNGYYRIVAFSEEPLNTDGKDLSRTGVKGIVGPRYISGYRFESEKTDPNDPTNNADVNTKGRWLHFHETDMSHSTIHTYADLRARIKAVDDAVNAMSITDDEKDKLKDRDVFNHTAMAGNIEILPADFDPSSIFKFTGTTTTNGYKVYNIGTQGLELHARPGGIEDNATPFGKTELNTVGSTPATGFDNKFRLADIGGGAVTLSTLKQNTGNWDTDVVENLKTNYVCIDRNHRYRITCHTDNEMVEIGDHYTNDGINGIQDTKWRLQPVGIHEDWPYNEMPLRVEVNKGGVRNSKLSEPELSDPSNKDNNYYGTLYVPFDTRLGNTTDAAFTLTATSVADGTASDPSTVTLASVSRLNEMGNPQFVPAKWPVVLRTSIDKHIVLQNQDGSTYATKNYVNLYIPNVEPTVINGAIDAIQLKGEYLEKTLSTDKTIMVFGLPFEGLASHSSHEYKTKQQVGFFRNDNWARENAPTKKAHIRSYPDIGNGTLVAADASERDNKYVYHNKIYYHSTSSLAREIIRVFFEGDVRSGGSFDEEDKQIDDGITNQEQNPWPCDVFDLQGRRVGHNETPETLRKNHPNLPPGIYIFGGKKVVVH